VASGNDLVILASGFMLHRALAVRDQLRMEGIDAAVVDLFRIKPLSARALVSYLDRYSNVATLEEQCLAGGFGSAVAEALVDHSLVRPLLRLGLPDRYFFENGGRNHILEKCGLGIASVAQRLTEFLAPSPRRRSTLPTIPTTSSF
jgi:transketolase C-terminal domain/subunit